MRRTLAKSQCPGPTAERGELPVERDRQGSRSPSAVYYVLKRPASTQNLIFQCYTPGETASPCVHQIYPPRLQKNKKAKERRIFVIGESAVYGILPLRLEETIPAQLQDILDSCYPDLDVYGINAGVTAVDSCFLKEMVPSILEFQPDLFVLYIGNNEFACSRFSLKYCTDSKLGRRDVKLSEIWMDDTRPASAYTPACVELLSLVFKRLRICLKYPELAGKPFSERVGALLIQNHDNLYRDILQHSRENLLDMITEIRARGIPLILCTVASRERIYPGRGRRTG